MSGVANKRIGRDDVKKLIAATLSVAAMLCASASVAKESDRVLGESLDSGLGALPATYTGAEFLKLPAGHVAGEKLDNGLDRVTQEELQRIISAYQQRP
jgi:hypothetical protein